MSLTEIVCILNTKKLIKPQRKRKLLPKKTNFWVLQPSMTNLSFLRSSLHVLPCHCLSQIQLILWRLFFQNKPQDIVVLNASCIPEPALPKPEAERKLQHPHFGGKQPKQHKPLKCISVVCKEEKGRLAEELQSTHKELDKALEELSKC